MLPPVVALVQPGPDPLQEFDRYLERVRGSARATRIGYLREVRGFVKHVFGDSDPRWSAIGPEHVASYITRRAARLPITCRRDPITPLRAFLRHMTGEGLLPANLEHAIPPIRQWKHAALPVALSTEELAKVLSVPFEPTGKSLRNRAIVLLLARLGSAPAKYFVFIWRTSTGDRRNSWCAPARIIANASCHYRKMSARR